MLVENIIPMFLGGLFFMAVASVALVHTLFGRHDVRLYCYSFVILSLTTSLLALNWLERSGAVSSNQDNTSILLFIGLLLAISVYAIRQFRHPK
ncbi:MAG: hypothetical protein HUJ29_12945 [Gammaproteobacteria bacterium]|nr:hypothetical protein [Gammaproteobacteria bacterium]